MVKSHKELKRWYAPLEPGTPEAAKPARPVPALTAIDGGAQSVPASTSPGDGEQVTSTFEPRVVDSPPEWWVRDRSRPDYVGDWYDWVSADGEGADTADFTDSTDEAEDIPANLVPLPERAAADPAPAAVSASPPPDRHRIAVIIGAVAVLIVGLAAVATIVRVATGPAKHAPAPPEVSPAAAAPAPQPAAVVPAGPAAGFCPERHDPGVMQSAGPGSTATGPEAILRFQHAYYVDRSAAKAWEVAAPGAVVETQAGLQRAIDAVPLGTRHCVQVTDAGPGHYKVVVTVLGVDGKPRVYPMTITTNVVAGRALIASIAKA